jgi:hypothetical protein
MSSWKTTDLLGPQFVCRVLTKGMGLHNRYIWSGNSYFQLHFYRSGIHWVRSLAVF